MAVIGVRISCDEEIRLCPIHCLGCIPRGGKVCGHRGQVFAEAFEALLCLACALYYHASNFFESFVEIIIVGSA